MMHKTFILVFGLIFYTSIYAISFEDGLKVLNSIKTDVLIVGSGLSGASAAIAAAESGKHVILITKTDNLKSGNTPYAQGGIVYKGINDSPSSFSNELSIFIFNMSKMVGIKSMCLT